VASRPGSAAPARGRHDAGQYYGLLAGRRGTAPQGNLGLFNNGTSRHNDGIRPFPSVPKEWVAAYASSAGTLPAGWPYYTFWQYADSGTFPGDQDVFNGALSNLQVLADNG
jgi:hypothetical protein